MTGSRDFSDDTARLVDEEVQRILRAQEERARELLTKHRRGLDLVADALLDRETIDGSEVVQLVQEGLGDGGNGRVPGGAPARPREPHSAPSE
jgi:cell division protease FtsH